MSENNPSDKSESDGAFRSICALALLLVLDLWLVLARPLEGVPIAGLDQSEISQVITSYLSQNRTPDVVVFGSSLVTAPVLQSEALYLKRPIARFVHRRVHVLEEGLGKRLGREAQVFCLGAGGEMASDVYLITKNVLKSSRQPIAIIYGIAPRDFQDNLLPGLESTPSFQTLSTLSDLPERLLAPSMKLKQKMDLLFGRAWALWRYRHDIRVYLTLGMKQDLERFLPWVVFDRYNEKHELTQTRQGHFPEETAGELTAAPGIALEHLSVKEMLEDYNARYNPPSRSLVDAEFGYFERFLEICRDRGIAVLVINMPLSTTNKKLMAPGFYQDYLDNAVKLCQRYDLDFADLNQAPWDDLSNFVDTVHLKPELSARFLDAVASTAASSQVSLAMKRPRPALAQGRRIRGL